MNSKPFKIMVITVGLVLFSGVGFIANVFLGNPISAYLAEHAIKHYVDIIYPELDLSVTKAHYNFKTTSYMAYAQSKTSPDTHFSVYYEKGQVTGDHYEDTVLGKFNTLLRLEKECTKEIIPLLAKIPGLQATASLVQIDKGAYGSQQSNLIILDQPYEKSLPLEMTLYLQGESTDFSLADGAWYLTEVHQTLKQAGYHFAWYDLVLDSDQDSGEIRNVTPLDIESGTLEERLLAASQGVHPGANDQPKYQKRLCVLRKTA